MGLLLKEVFYFVKKEYEKIMGIQNNLSRFDRFVNLGKSGGPEDVKTLMSVLEQKDDMASSKLIDYALSLVRKPEGIEMIRRYLFQGNAAQSNFAALYFKRRGNLEVLKEAYAMGKIDDIQAFSN